MSQARARVAAFEDRQLLTKGKVIKDEIATGAESRATGAEEAQEDGSHHVTMSQVRRDRRQFSAMGAWPTPPPSAMEATRIGFWLGTGGKPQGNECDLQGFHACPPQELGTGCGRDDPFGPLPAQIRTSGITASGSCLRL